MTIIEDTRQQIHKHDIENAQLESLGVKILRSKLPVGDYALINSFATVVDTKKDMQELVGNICSGGKKKKNGETEHDRFRNECILAQENNIKLIVLIENEDGITCIDDVFKWVNPRLKIMKNSNEVIGFTRSGYPKYRKVQAYPRATKGQALAKAMLTMQLKYGVEFQFCQRSEAGAKIIELLTLQIKI